VSVVPSVLAVPSVYGFPPLHLLYRVGGVGVGDPSPTLLLYWPNRGIGEHTQNTQTGEHVERQGYVVS